MFPLKKPKRNKDFPEDLTNLDDVVFCAFKYATESNNEIAAEAISTFLINNFEKIDKRLKALIKVKLINNDNLKHTKYWKKVIKLLEK